MMTRTLFLAAAVAALSMHDMSRADPVHGRELADERSVAITSETPAIRQGASQAPANRMQAQPNVSKRIEGTDVSGSDLPGILPPGATYYDHPYCCGIHCSCDSSQ